MKKKIALMLAAMLLLSACGEPAASSGAVSASEAEQTASSVSESESVSAIPDGAETEIALEGDKITVSGPGAKVTDTTVTITQAGHFRITGTLDDGQILVDAGKEDDVYLTLDGADISCSTTAPIYVTQAGSATIQTEAGTENTVTDTANYVFAAGEDEPDAAIFSKDDLVLFGEGKLTVSGNYSMAVHGKDELTVAGGEYDLTAVGDGLKGKDSVHIFGGSVVKIDAGEDGIQANNDKDEMSGIVSIDQDSTLDINAGKDGIKAVSALSIGESTIHVTAQGDGLQSDSYTIQIKDGDITIDAQEDGIQGANLEISGGNLDITTGGGAENAPEHTEQMGFKGWFDTSATTTEDTASAKGLKADGDLTVSGGTINLNCMDDALHCAGTLTVSDQADLTIATGDDALHSDAALNITGGKINVTKSYEGLEGVYITISGGETTLVTSDDGINAAGGTSADTDFAFMGPPGGEGTSETLEDATYYFHMTDGILNVDAGGDGLDSNGAMFIDGGEIYVSGPTDSMNGGLDYTTTGQVNGGIVVVAGASGMAQNFDASSSQPSLLYGFSAQIEGGSTVTLADADGNVLVETTMAKAFNSVVISLPELTVGETYTLTCGGETAEVELTSAITTVGAAGGMGGPGGMGRGGMMPPGAQPPQP